MSHASIYPVTMDFILDNIREIIAVICAYFVGCFSTGYYLVRFRTGKDIRELGSTSVGANNVKRLLGWSGFIITFAGDAVKGMIVVGGAVYFDLEQLGIMLVVISVVAGHIWPVQLHFRGGKGIATVIGALVVLDYQLVLIQLAFFGVVLALSRRYTFSGLLAVTLSPVVAFLMGRSLIAIIGISVTVVIVLIAHRDNIRTVVSTFRRVGDAS